MIQRLLLTLAIPLLLFETVKAQKVEIVFDSSGKMIEFPPAVLRRKIKVTFKVKVSANWLESQKGVLATLLTQTKTYLSDEDANTAYKCLLDNNNELSDYTTELGNAITALNHPAFSIADTTVLRGLTTTAYSNIPVDQYFQNLLDHQFEVRIYNDGTLLQSIPLQLERLRKGSKYLYFVPPPGMVFRARNADKDLSGSAPPDQFKFVLFQRDPLNTTALAWNTVQIGLLTAANGVHLDQVEDGLVKIHDTTNPTVFKNGVDKVKQLHTWFIKWFWFTGGELVTNPFGNLQDQALKDLSIKIAGLKNQQWQQQVKLNFFDSCIARLRKLERKKTTLDSLLNDRDAALLQWKKDSADLAKSEKAYKAATTATSIASSSLLYAGDLFSSVTGHVNVMKQYDASLDYRSVFKWAHPPFPSRWSKERVTEVPDNEAVYLVIQNTPAGAKLGFGEKRFDYDDQEEFTKVVSEQLAKVDFSSIPTANLANLSSFITGLAKAKATVGATFGGPSNCDIGSKLQKLLIALADKKQAIPPDPDLFQAKDGTNPVYASTTKMASLTQQYEAPFRDSITIQDISKPDAPKDLAKSYIRVGALRTVQIAAGVAFVRTPTSTTSIDTSGNGFKTSTNDNAASVVVGFKVYPFKNYNRDKGLIPRYFFRRFSAFGGFDMLHPLNNFYLGGAYDIVPGLALAVGNNYYKQTTYTIANNQIVDTKHVYASGGLFYSVTINPTLFVQFVKLFFK